MNAMTPGASIDERHIESALRPRSLDEFVGQHRVFSSLVHQV
jgi:Holliday junction resolvasome RuvABC ATP-dependent DNA helicase subunit